MDMFCGRIAHLASMHKKEAAIAPLLQEAFQVQVVVPEGFNTDVFGTFTRERKRPGSQYETARMKIRELQKTSPYDLFIASEGSFGIHPGYPFTPSNLELVHLVDSKQSLEITGRALSVETNLLSKAVSSKAEIEEFLTQIGFPDHGIILRISDRWSWAMVKDLHSTDEVIDRAQKWLRWPGVNRVYLETDMRAHRNPTRMKVIEQATMDLIQKMKSLCPICNTPGFCESRYEGIALCRVCHRETLEKKYVVKDCQRCHHLERISLHEDGAVPPSQCPSCNP